MILDLQAAQLQEQDMVCLVQRRREGLGDGEDAARGLLPDGGGKCHRAIQIGMAVARP